MLSAGWWSEIGLILDAIGFAILSVDLVRSMHGERLARDEIQKLEKTQFAWRYGFFAPSQEVQTAQQQEFDAQQAERRKKSEEDMNSRARWAYFAIFLAVLGLGMQLYGGWPGET